MKKTKWVETSLNEVEAGRLLNALKDYFDGSRDGEIRIRQNGSSGIGVNTRVVFGNVDKDITDYDAW